MQEKISGKKLKSLVFEKFPQVSFQWVPDKHFWVPTIDEVKHVVELTHTQRLPFIENINDCDDFTLHLHSAVNLYRATLARDMKIPSNQHIPWAFGEAFGFFQNETYPHSLNIALTQQGFYLIEPQDDNIWSATRKDIIFCVKF
jgi:hypothetical protein